MDDEQLERAIKDSFARTDPLMDSAKADAALVAFKHTILRHATSGARRTPHARKWIHANARRVIPALAAAALIMVVTMAVVLHNSVGLHDRSTLPGAGVPVSAAPPLHGGGTIPPALPGPLHTVGPAATPGPLHAVGPAATPAPRDAVPTASVVLTSADAPAPFWYEVHATGFPADSLLQFVCYDSGSPQGFYSGQVTSDPSGLAAFSECWSRDGPEHWVTVNGIASNIASWPASPPSR